MKHVFSLVRFIPIFIPMAHVRWTSRSIGVLALSGILMYAFQNCSNGYSAIKYEALVSTCSTATEPFGKDKAPEEIARIDMIGFTPDGESVPKESPLLAVIDNKCLTERGNPSEIQSWIAPDETLIPDLRYQSYPIDLPRDFTLTELRAKADADVCVLGLRVNRALELNVMPNDPLIPRQAADLNSMQTSEAYDILFPGNVPLTKKAVVAVIDSGIRYYDPAYEATLRQYQIEIYRSHPDLENVLWRDDLGVVGSNFGSTIEAFRKYPIDMGSVYRSVTTGQIERTFHGTHVSGIIGASSGNGIGINGVANNAASIMPVRVTVDKIFKAAGYDTGSATSLSVLYNAVQYAVEPAGKTNQRIADVINISMGTSPIPKADAFAGIDTILRSALNLAVAKGAVVAVAAGNSNKNLGSYFVQPASLGESINGVITVGSLNSTTMNRSSFSNYGATAVEIAAPGSNVLSAINEDEDDPQRPNHPENTVGYGILSGTSMAAPQVAGAMALAVAYLRSNGVPYTPAQIENLILNSAQPTVGFSGASSSQDGSKNRGRLDLKNLALALKAKVDAHLASSSMQKLTHEELVNREAAKVSLFDCP